MMRRLVAALIASLLIVPGASVASQPAVISAGEYRWEAGDLAFNMPAGWSVIDADSGVPVSTQGVQFSNGTGTLFVYTASPATALITALNDGLASAGYLLLDYGNDTIWGVTGLRANVISADRAAVGRVLAGRAPDGRIVVIGGGAPRISAADWETAFSALWESLSFSASAPPTPRLYRPAWRADGLPGIVGLAASTDAVYAVEAERGVTVLNAETGVNERTAPFPNPSQPTGIVQIDDTAVIGDTVCRCLQRLLPDGTWGASYGVFGGNAPVHLAADAAGTVYAIDEADGGYQLQIIGTDERATSVPLSFNAAAPPLVAASPVTADDAQIMEWLASLLDSSLSGAVSALAEDALMLRGWLPITPDQVRDVALHPAGDLVLALADGRIARLTTDLQLIELFRADAQPRALAISPGGMIVTADEFGTVIAYRDDLPANRSGHPMLRTGVPVIGTVTADATIQAWTYEGQTGERVTLAALDSSETDGLDIALRVYAPDGREIAYNDDHGGGDLPGFYAAQIRDLVLESTGSYRVVVEWVQGTETPYALTLTRDHTFAPSSDAPANLTGRIFPSQPVERWVFDAAAGQSITVTMTGDTGDLDPVLTLYDPFGGRLAYNDDGRDPALGIDAQLFRVVLPADGQYIIEASRFAGAGSYDLIVVFNS